MSGVKFQAVLEFIYLFYTNRIWIYCYQNNCIFFWHGNSMTRRNWKKAIILKSKGTIHLKVVNLHTYIYIDITYIFIHLHICIFPELWSVVQEEPIKTPGSHLIYCFLNYLKNIIISVGTWRSHVDIRFTHILCSYLFTISLKNLPIVNVN